MAGQSKRTASGVPMDGGSASGVPMDDGSACLAANGVVRPRLRIMRTTTCKHVLVAAVPLTHTLCNLLLALNCFRERLCGKTDQMLKLYLDCSQLSLKCKSVQMIVEDEREQATIHIDLNENPGASFALPPEVNVGGNLCFADVLRRKAAIHARPHHTQLKNDLIEHIWQRLRNSHHN